MNPSRNMAPSAGPDFSAPSNNLMALIREMQGQHADAHHSLAKDPALPEDNSLLQQQQQQLLQVQSHLRLLQQLAHQPSSFTPQTLPLQQQLQALNTLSQPAEVTLGQSPPLQHLLLQLQQSQQVPAVPLQSLLNSLPPPHVAQAAVQQLQLQQLLQLQRRQQQQQQQQQQHLQRQLLQQQLAQQQLLQLQQQHQQKQQLMQLQDHLRRQQQEQQQPARPVPAVEVKPARLASQAQRPRPDAVPVPPPAGGGAGDVQQMLRALLHLGPNSRRGEARPQDPPVDAAKTSALLALLSPGGAPAEGPSLALLGDRLPRPTWPAAPPQPAAAAEATSADKTDLLCSLLGVPSGKSPLTTLPPMSAASGSLPATGPLTRGPFAPSPALSPYAAPFVPAGATAASRTAAVQNLLLAMSSLTPSTPAAPPLPDPLPSATLGAPSLLGLPDVSRDTHQEARSSTAPATELAPVIQALQLHQLLAQRGGGPARFSHHSGAGADPPREVQADKGAADSPEAEPTLMRIQAGDQGITDFQWLINLMSKRPREPAGLANVPAAGLGTWLHTEGKEPTQLTPAKPGSDSWNMETWPPGTSPGTSHKTVYSHHFMKELQFSHATRATPAWIPKELIRDDERPGPLDRDWDPLYDEHDHRDASSDGDDGDGPPRRGGPRRGYRRPRARPEWRRG